MGESYYQLLLRLMYVDVRALAAGLAVDRVLYLYLYWR
jgi:hypothetical protein